MALFSKTFDFNFRRDQQKNFLWASRLWVGRRKEPILGYVSKNDEKNNSGGKGLIVHAARVAFLFPGSLWLVHIPISFKKYLNFSNPDQEFEIDCWIHDQSYRTSTSKIIVRCFIFSLVEICLISGGSHYTITWILFTRHPLLRLIVES